MSDVKKTPLLLVAEIRNALPHLVKDNQDPTTLRVFWALGIIDEALGKFATLVDIVNTAIAWEQQPGAPLLAALAKVAQPAPAAPREGFLIDVNLPASPDNCYMDAATTAALTKALDNRHVTSDERNKMALSLAKLSQRRGESALAKLEQAIADRQADEDRQANQDLVGAHEIPAQAPAQLTPQQIRDQKQAEQYGAQGSEASGPVDDFAAVAEGAKKTRAKKPAAPVKPAGELELENLLKPTGHEDQLIDEAQPRTGANIYASLAQKTKLLQAAQDPKVTNAERSKLFLAINKISYAEAEKCQEKLAGWIKDRPTPEGVLPSRSPKAVAPAGEVKPAQGAVSPSALPWEQ